MADQRNGGIAWCTETWNPLRGCTRVSAGCINCYAESMAARFSGEGLPYEGTINPETKRWNGTIKLVNEHLQDPLRWKRPRMVFVNSMSDLFHEDVPDEFIDQVFAVMTFARQHTFQVLTKRPKRMQEYMSRDPVTPAFLEMFKLRNGIEFVGPMTNCPRKNIWLGVTVENQEAADERIPLLLQTPAAVRWLSMEPLLGAVDLALLGTLPRSQHANYTQTHDLLHWVVVGGESGSNARPMHPDWARSLRDQCAEAGVSFLFKQWGEWHTKAFLASSGTPVFRQFGDFQQWVNKAQTWVQGGICLDHDGRELKNGGDMMRARDDEKFPVTIMHRVGKKAAGRLLDGVLHDGYPS